MLTNSAFSRTQPGGYFKPVNCKVRDTVAVIVPYRDREEHLKTFLDYMHSFLQRQPIQYIIYVVEMVRTRYSCDYFCYSLEGWHLKSEFDQLESAKSSSGQMFTSREHLISSQSLPSKQNTGFLIFKSLTNAESLYRPK